jgi:hypothetical protein
MIATSTFRTVVLFLVGGCSAALTGCSNPARDRLIGKWEAGIEEGEEDVTKMTPTDNPIASRFGKVLMKSIQAEMSWEFASDNTVTATATLLGQPVTRRGTWQFVRGDEHESTITIQLEDEESRELTFTFSDSDTVEVEPFSSESLQLTRLVKFKRVASAR